MWEMMSMFEQRERELMREAAQARLAQKTKKIRMPFPRALGGQLIALGWRLAKSDSLCTRVILDSGNRTLDVCACC